MPKEEANSGATKAFAPKQERSEKTRVALLSAAKELIAEGGVGAVTIAKVAARSGLTKGAFYARFPDKAALLDTISQEMDAETSGIVTEFLARMAAGHATLAEMLKDAVPLTIQISRERWAIHSQLSLNPWGEGDLRINRPDALEEMVAAMRTLFHKHKDEFTHPDPDMAASMFSVYLSGICDAAILAQEVAPKVIPESDDKLAEEIIRALSGYLGLRA